MAYKLKYNMYSSGNNAIMDYGIINSIPTLAKKSITLSGTISAETQGVSGKVTEINGILYYKINNGTEQELCTMYTYHSGVGTVSASNTFSITINLASVSKLAFKFDADLTSGRTGNFNADIFINVGNVASTETTISADWVNKISDLLGISQSASVGSDIKRGRYTAIASAVGSSTIDTSYPKASDLSAMVTAINSSDVSTSWDSTSSSDY